MTEKIITYAEFLNNKGNLRKYLDKMFLSIPNIVVYFPKSLTKEERYMIYTISKGYVFEKLKESLNYSIKMWRNTNSEFSNINFDNRYYETRLKNLEEDIEKMKKELKQIRRIYNVAAFLSSFSFGMLIYEYFTHLDYNCYEDYTLFDFNSSLEISSYQL